MLLLQLWRKSRRRRRRGGAGIAEDDDGDNRSASCPAEDDEDDAESRGDPGGGIATATNAAPLVPFLKRLETVQPFGVDQENDFESGEEPGQRNTEVASGERLQ